VVLEARGSVERRGRERPGGGGDSGGCRFGFVFVFVLVMVKTWYIRIITNGLHGTEA
jgi:hypothetical protein